MGFLANYKAKRKDTSAFKSMVAKRTLQERRKSFAEESVAQAKLQGKALAQPKKKRSIGSILEKKAVAYLSKRPAPRKAYQPQSRPAPRRKTSRRRKAPRKAYQPQSRPAPKEERVDLFGSVVPTGY